MGLIRPIVGLATVVCVALGVSGTAVAQPTIGFSASAGDRAGWLSGVDGYGGTRGQVIRRAAAASAPRASTITGEGFLSYLGGPVLHSSAPYLVFWTPSGESIPARSRSLMARYFTDVAADSGKVSNVFGVLRQYYDRTGFADYRQTFDPRRQVIIDRRPYPQRDPTACPYVSPVAWVPAAWPPGTHATCISDAQIRSELQRLITADRLPTAGSHRAAFPGQGFPFPGLLGEGIPGNPIGGHLSANAPIYFVVLPANVEFCYFRGTQCTANLQWGYHLSFTDAQGNVVLYAPISMDPNAGGPPPPPFSGRCDLGVTGVQEPNRDRGDCAINTLSHEDSETITDPIGDVSHSGWFATIVNDIVGQESGDACVGYGSFDPAHGRNPDAYAPTLGGSAAAGTLYTQLINRHRYYTQSEWSNGNANCEMRPSPGRIIPRFAAPRRPVKVGRSLRFDPAVSRSRNPLSSATWQFGDGSPTAFFSASATLTSVEHRYRKPGRYTVTLTLVDDHGSLKTTTRLVTVHRR
jgi:hypothetical protein